MDLYLIKDGQCRPGYGGYIQDLSPQEADQSVLELVRSIPEKDLYRVSIYITEPGVDLSEILHYETLVKNGIDNPLDSGVQSNRIRKQDLSFLKTVVTPERQLKENNLAVKKAEIDRRIKFYNPHKLRAIWNSKK